jgi:hypothetical protein
MGSKAPSASWSAEQPPHLAGLFPHLPQVTAPLCG